MECSICGTPLRQLLRYVNGELTTIGATQCPRCVPKKYQQKPPFREEAKRPSPLKTPGQTPRAAQSKKVADRPKPEATTPQQPQWVKCSLCNRKVLKTALVNHQRSHKTPVQPPLNDSDQALSDGFVRNADGTLTFEDDCLYIEWLRTLLIQGLLRFHNLQNDDQLVSRYGSQYGLNIEDMKDKLLWHRIWGFHKEGKLDLFEQTRDAWAEYQQQRRKQSKEQLERVLQQMRKQPLQLDDHELLRRYCSDEEAVRYLEQVLTEGKYPEYLQAVSEPSRIILDMRFGKGKYPFAEIARQQRCSIDQVRQLFEAGIRQLLTLHNEGYATEVVEEFAAASRPMSEGQSLYTSRVPIQRIVQGLRHLADQARHA